MSNLKLGQNPAVLTPNQPGYYSQGFEPNPEATVNRAVSIIEGYQQTAGDGIDDGGSVLWATAKYTGATVWKGLLQVTGLQDFENAVGKSAHVNVKASEVESKGQLNDDVKDAMFKAKLESRGEVVLTGSQFATSFAGAGKAGSLAKDGVTTVSRKIPEARYRGLKSEDDRLPLQIMTDKGMQAETVRHGKKGKLTIDEHVNTNLPSNWVATTDRAGIAENSYYTGMQGFVFELHAPGGVDVADYFKKLGKPYKKAGERETAFDGTIAPRYIKGFYSLERFNGEVTHRGPFIPNPQFRPKKDWHIQWGRNPK